MKVWAFEDAPASSEAARDRYIRNAGSADLVIWLIGSTTSDPVVEEVDACLAAGGRPLPFLLPAQHRDSQTEELIRRVQKVVTWRKVEDIERLPEHIRTALSDEIARRVRNPVPWNHDLYLDQKYQESIADTKRLWTTFRVPDDVAESLAKDESIGNRIEPPSSGIVIVKASQGVRQDIGGTSTVPAAANTPTQRPPSTNSGFHRRTECRRIPEGPHRERRGESGECPHTAVARHH